MQQINEMLLPFFQIGFLLCVAFLLIWNRVLILRVVKFRREKKIILGTGDDEELILSLIHISEPTRPY